MNKRFLIYIVLGFIAATIGVSCNSSESSSEDTISSNVAITSFYIGADDSVLVNIDSVFFTIDLNKAEIYNADSLPKGTKVTKLLVNMTYPACYAIDVNVKNGEVMKNDTTFSYSSTDSIDFTGDVKITITSEDQTTKRTYSVKVNVHNMEPDSLYWNQLSRRDLPCLSDEVSDQKTVQLNGDVYCMMVDRGRYVVAKSSNLAANSWTKTIVELPFSPAISSLTATSNALYILSNDNSELYSSTDGLNWTSCGVYWHSILGGYDDTLLGIIKENTTFLHAEYPASGDFVATAVEDGFPITGASNLVTYITKWNTSAQSLMIGGVDADGNKLGTAWGYDGTSWGLISGNTISPRDGMVLVPYFTYEINDTRWTVTSYTTWIAFGGYDDNGVADNLVYYSRDNGVTWAIGGDLLQLPDYIPDVAYANVVVESSTLTSSRSTSEWVSYSSKELPVWYMIAPETTASMSRAVTPVTSWECPYIYLFGGYTNNTTLSNSIWKGVINRLSFKPIY